MASNQVPQSSAPGMEVARKNMLKNLVGVKPAVERCVTSLQNMSHSSGREWQDAAKPLLEKTFTHLDEISGALRDKDSDFGSDTDWIAATNTQYTQLLHMSVQLVDAVVSWEELASQQNLKIIQTNLSGVDSQLKYLKEHLIDVVGSMEQVGEKLLRLVKTRDHQTKGELIFQMDNTTTEMDIAKDRLLRVEKKIRQLRKNMVIAQERHWWYSVIAFSVATSSALMSFGFWYSGKIDVKVFSGSLAVASSGASLFRHFNSHGRKLGQCLTEVMRREERWEELSQLFSDSRKRMKLMMKVINQPKRESEDNVNWGYTNLLVAECARKFTLQPRT